MDIHDITKALSAVTTGQVRYFQSIGSTNVEAARWVQEGAPDGSIVIANEQTAGRGRGSREWITPPGVSLAFSLILKPTPGAHVQRYAGLGAVAVLHALQKHHNLHPQIKWPNDVLINGKKVCGILAEASWTGDQLNAVILGIGLNIAQPSVPDASDITFPASCIEAYTRTPVDRIDLLRAIIEEIFNWKEQINTDIFTNTWFSNLAFRGQTVSITIQQGERWLGEIIGLEPSGALVLRASSGEIRTFHAGDLYLRPVDSPPK